MIKHTGSRPKTQIGCLVFVHWQFSTRRWETVRPSVGVNTPGRAFASSLASSATSVSACRCFCKTPAKRKKTGQLPAGNTEGGRISVPLTSCLNGLEFTIWQLTIFVFICRLIQTSQTGGQWYSDTSTFGIPWCKRLKLTTALTTTVKKVFKFGSGV